MDTNQTRVTDGIPDVDERDRRNFLKVLGITGSVGAASELSLADLRGAVGAESAEQLATMGEAIRADLAGGLDASRLDAAVGGIEVAAATLPELRAAGFPDEPASAYAELTDPAWDAYHHLGEVGLFGSAERHLPEFTPEHVRATAAELVRAEPAIAALAEVGFDERERTAVVVDAVTENHRLGQWVSTASLPADPEGYDPSNVAPLHQRALGGALLWIDELDHHLWQREAVLTEAHLDRTAWDVKRMLGGAYLLVTAAADLAGPAELSDSQLTAAIAGGSAVAIRGQEALAEDVFRVSDADRAPVGGESA